MDEFFEQNWKKGMTAESLLAQYSLYGEDPVVLPSTPPGVKHFSASDYAAYIAEDYCRRRKKK